MRSVNRAHLCANAFQLVAGLMAVFAPTVQSAGANISGDKEVGMCTSYESNEHEKFEAFSLFAAPAFNCKREIYKDYVAPIFRRGGDGWRTDAATFGTMPRNRIPPHVKPFDTMNVRAESV